MSEPTEAPKRRGRPPGSKTKSKTEIKRPRGRPPKPKEPEREATEGEDAISERLGKTIKRSTAALQPDDETLRIVGECAKLFCTQPEAAAMLGVTHRMFKYFLETCQDARDIWDDGHNMARTKLRSVQMKLAEKNQVIAIFLGKNYLGQKDVQTTDMNVSTKPAAEMTLEQLMEIAGQAVPPKPDSKQVH